MLRAASTALLVGIVACGCGRGPSTGAANGAVKVVAAENFWGDIASQLGGSHVAVRSIISDPTTDPHQYESDAGDAAAVADARVVIVNGVGYDDAIDKLLSVTSNRGRVVVSIEKVLGATGSNANPHLWYDLPRIPEVARAIEAALVAADAADASTFAANLKSFDASLSPVDRLVAEIKAKYPRAPVAYTERVPGYLLNAAGLVIATPPGFAQAIEDGNEPNAHDTQAMNALISGHRIRVLLYNAQATSAVTQHVQDQARRAGIPVVPVTETLPHGLSYQAWQEQQLRALLTALGG